MKLITLGDSITRGTFTNFGESCPYVRCQPQLFCNLKNAFERGRFRMLRHKRHFRQPHVHRQRGIRHVYRL